MLREKTETQEQAEKAMKTGRTFCSEQLTKFLECSNSIYEELGGWATDYYIEASIDQLRLSLENDTSMTRLDRAERVFLLELLGMAVPVNTTESIHLSPKLEALLAFLEKMDRPGFSGLVFAKRRATVSVLARILSLCPATKDRFRCASYVGWSSTRSKDALGDLLSRDMQKDTLSEFRAGRKNLIVATDVLEEGLDVSSCSLVICYDKPSNLKSFVQRRGRARYQESTYAVMISTEDETVDLRKWQELENAMVEAYQDDQRRRREAWELEEVDEVVADYLYVLSTNARLPAEDAMQHLHHFCAVLPVDQYVDNRPMFSFEEDASGLVRGTVTLPNSVHPAVRRIQGKSCWRTERAARKETAFQAYKALYEYGLVNDNLLPLTRKPELRFAEETDVPAIVDGSAQYDPYVELAHAWSSSQPQLYRTTITVSNRNTGMREEDLSMSIILPRSTAMPDPINLYWESDVTFVATFASPEPLEGLTIDTVKIMQEITAIYLQAPSSRVQPAAREYVALFAPNIPHEQFKDWSSRYDGTEQAVDIHTRDASTPPTGIIRDRAKYSEPRLFKKWIIPDDDPKRALEIECQSIPRRRNFLQRGSIPVPGEDGEPVSKIYQMPAVGCTIDRLPASKAMFGLLISALLDRFEATLVAHRLNQTILKGVGIENLSHVLTAITTPIAQANTHYQLYEFFGDSVLKFTVSCQLFFAQPTWHEGYLSESRDKLIKNKRLARAALDTGLDSFILTDRFTPRKWDAPRVSQKSTYIPNKRKISMKVLADVVEALIGAAYMDGGMHKAQACLHRFLPEINHFTSNLSSVLGPADRGSSNLIDPHRLAPLLGYKFNDASLLTEALTHPSCEYDTTTQSYQRIEYLGDAVLDMVVVSVLAAHPDQLSQGTMTLIKHAVVNANLLAFLCMDHTSPDESTEVTQTPAGYVDFVPRLDEIHLWRFLRFHGPVIKNARDACVERYHSLRDNIRFALEHGDYYPWELFASLRADKFISDIVESTLGAMFIDSHGDMEQCYAFAERIGLLAYLRRVISDGVNVQHPRNTAQNMVKASGNLVFKTKRVEKKGVMATYRSSAVINKEEIALVEGCASAEEAEVKVSHLVIAKLSAKEDVME
jgi:dsRNA-specific ribonuclease